MPAQNRIAGRRGQLATEPPGSRSMTEPAAAAAPAPTDPTAAPAAPPPPAAAPGPPAAHDAAAPATAASPLARDPRFATCGFAKLLGDNGLEYYVQKYEVVLGRRSKAGNVDVVLGDSAVLSRQHARIYYSFEAQRWEVVAEGKNGLSVNGTLLTPQSGPRPLQSQDFLQAGDQNLYFLLPRQPRKPRAPKAKAGTPPPQQQDLQQQQPQQQQPQQQQQQQPPQQQQQQPQQQQPLQPGLLPAGSGPLLPGVGSVGPGSGWGSPRLGLPQQVAAGGGSSMPDPPGLGGLQLQLQAAGGASRSGLGGGSGGGGLMLPQESAELGFGLGLLLPGAGGMRLLDDDAAGGDEQGGDMQLG